MVKGLYTAYTGMINEQKRLDVLSNNLANADTNGYKKEGTTSQTFADELAIKIKDTSSYGLAQKLARVIYGADKNQTGKLFVNGKEAKINAPIDAMNLGMGLLPDDRKAEGIIADLSVRENIILAMQAKRGMFKLLPMSRQNEIADKYIELLQIKTASRETLIGQLSGGNQQKVILARWLATDPEFLILDEPTRGIDVGTKTEIQKLVIELADQGKSLIFISSEIEEMLRTCSKLVVLRDGQEVGEITEELTQGHVMQSIAGGGRNE